MVWVTSEGILVLPVFFGAIAHTLYLLGLLWYCLYRVEPAIWLWLRLIATLDDDDDDDIDIV